MTAPNRSTANATFVDQWNSFMDNDLEGTFPPNDSINKCEVRTNPQNAPRPRWGKDTYRRISGVNAIWPAVEGDGAVTPPTNYPADFETWLLCGPYDLSDEENFMVRFKHWYDIWGYSLTNVGDTIFVGVSTDITVTEVSYFKGKEWKGPTDSLGIWLNETVFFPDAAGYARVWVAWKFTSQYLSPGAPGWWLDDLEIWTYDQPALDCANQDWSYENKGYKGLGFQAYDGPPIIRLGDTKALTHVVESDARWVRLPFVHQLGDINLQEYDRVIDSLCASGISVLGVVHNETLWRDDFNTPDTAEDYRAQFSARASDLALYYKRRIKYWEVWNEPDGGDTLIREELFEPLISNTYAAIRQANPDAIIIMGGVGSAWSNGGHFYFTAIYQRFKQPPWLSRPFDRVGVHPYYRYENGYSPAEYFYQDLAYRDPTTSFTITVGPTILNKFIDVIGDDHKPIWITELGWNANITAPPENNPPGAQCTHPPVSRDDQAVFLKISFDILLNEPKFTDGTRAVEKVFWFGYKDFSVEKTCKVDGVDKQVVTAEWWGLYDGNRDNPNQPAQCFYAAYPNQVDCGGFVWKKVYLPLTIRD